MRSPIGKTDRQALPLPGTSRPELDNKYVEPRNPVEKVLSKIWTEILDLDMVGIHDNYLELGGDSLQATRIISRVIAAFRVEISLKSLIDSSTVAQMELIIAQHQAKEANREDIDRILVEFESPEHE